MKQSSARNRELGSDPSPRLKAELGVWPHSFAILVGIQSIIDVKLSFYLYLLVSIWKWKKVKYAPIILEIIRSREQYYENHKQKTSKYRVSEKIFKKILKNFWNCCNLLNIKAFDT